MCDEEYDSEWYIDNVCSRKMTERREKQRQYISLSDGGIVKYGNNVTREIQGYGMITNGEFSI